MRFKEVELLLHRVGQLRVVGGEVLEVDKQGGSLSLPHHVALLNVWQRRLVHIGGQGGFWFRREREQEALKVVASCRDEAGIVASGHA